MWLPALLCGLLVAEAVAAPTGQVVLKDGRKWDNVQFEMKNGRMYVTFPNNRGGTDVPMDEVESYRADTTAAPRGGDEEEAPAEGGAAAAGGAVAPATLDWEGRFRLEPPEGWQAVPPSSPLMRAQLRHAEKDATLAVFIRQVQGDWDLSKGLAKGATDEITADLAARYARAAGARTLVGTLFDTPVVRVDGALVAELGSSVQKKMTELRFRRFGLEYSLTYVVGGTDDAPLAAGLPRLFEAFTFLPAVTHTEAVYSDYGRGFSIERANADWQLLGAPFDAEQPVRIRTADDRAELLVEVHQGTDAEAVVRGIIAQRLKTSRTLTNQKVEAGDQGGSTVKRYQFEDYRNPGGRKKLLFKGFAALLAGRVVVFTGIHPMADDDARKLEGDLETMLSRVRLWDSDRIRAQLNKSQNVLALVAQGAAASAAKRHQEALQKFDEALTLDGSFARALYLRALTKRDLSDFNGQREDLEQAAALDPTAKYDAALVDSYAAEAKAAEAQKNWIEAFRLYVRVYRADRSEVNLRKVTASATALFNEHKKDMAQLGRNLGRLEVDLRPFLAEPLVVQWLGQVYKETAGLYLRDKKFRDAKKWAERAKKLAPDARTRQEAETLLQQIEQQADAAAARPR